jgi:hypothetical protein
VELFKKNILVMQRMFLPEDVKFLEKIKTKKMEQIE